MPPRARQTPGKPAKPAPKRVNGSTTRKPREMPALPPAEVNVAEDDFLSFWSQHKAKKADKHVTICGVTVKVPTDVPLKFDEYEARLAQSTSKVDSDEAEAEFIEMLDVLFGDGVYKQWHENGMTGLQLRVVTAWGMANAKGREMTFEQAAEVVEQAMADEAAGKTAGPNRAARRAAGRSSQTPG